MAVFALYIAALGCPLYLYGLASLLRRLRARPGQVRRVAWPGRRRLHEFDPAIVALEAQFLVAPMTALREANNLLEARVAEREESQPKPAAREMKLSFDRALLELTSRQRHGHLVP